MPRSENMGALGFLLIPAIIIALTAGGFVSSSRSDTIVQGPGVTRIARLSDYLPSLKGTYGDSDVYFLEGKEPGGKVFVIGGVHPNEPAGFLAAVLLIENAVIEKGTMIVIPQANLSGFRNASSEEANPPRFEIVTPWGSRSFRLGDRYTSQLEQWPDPEFYTHYPSRQVLSGPEVRNLNRVFPGRPNGLFTERLAFAIAETVRQEEVDISIDLHEASLMYPIVNVIVAHQRATQIGAMAMMNLNYYEKIKIGMEISPEKLHGLSHRELGDYTQSMVLLAETSNPMMDYVRGRTDVDLVLNGKDEQVLRAAKAKLLFAPYPDEGVSLDERVGRHMATVSEIIAAYSKRHPDRPVVAGGLPGYQEVQTKGIGHYLRQPADN